MPISSGANTWPTQYFHKPPPPQPVKEKSNLPHNWWNTKTTVRPKSKGVVPNNGLVILHDQQPVQPLIQHIIVPSEPPMCALADPQPQQTVVLQRQPTVIQRQPTIIQRQPITMVQRQPTVIVQDPPMYPHYPPKNQYPYPGGYGRTGGGFYGNGCDPDCCADGHFTNEMYGAQAGCCQGGMFGSRRTYPPGTLGNLKGTGQRRCCAFIFGIILGLLLLGLLFGLLFGLKPALDAKTVSANVANTYPNGYYYNGVYYYPITNPPQVFYLAMGFNIPCNANNNNNLIAGVTSSYVTVGGDPNTTAPVTQQVPITNPNCNQITTAFVLANAISGITTTTTVPFVTVSDSSKIGINMNSVLVFLLIHIAYVKLSRSG